MPRIGEDYFNPSVGDLKERKDCRAEAIIETLTKHGFVEPFKDASRAVLEHRERAKRVTHEACKRSRSCSLATDIADHDRPATLAAKDIEEVAADDRIAAGRLIDGIDFQSFDLRKARWNQ